eukprot:PhM_4_TR14351/c0_g1_i1/m.93988
MQTDFNLDRPRYDVTTYAGRLLNHYDNMDPRTLILGQSDVEAARVNLNAYRQSTQSQRDEMLRDPAKLSQLWHSRRVIDVASHPDTGDSIFPLFRFSAFVPVNMFIVTATLHPVSVRSPAVALFMHWLNNSYNCALNFANRNASSEVSTQDLLMGYVTACSLSMGIAVGTAQYLRKLSMDSMSAKVVRATLPFTAVALSGIANLCLMRRMDWLPGYPGVKVYDDEGTCHGESLAAGRTGIAKCSMSRFVWNIPAMMLPPALMIPLSTLSFVRRHPRVVEPCLIFCGLTLGIPMALALFQQQDVIAVDGLEERFHNLQKKNGEPVTHVVYNKGL